MFGPQTGYYTPQLLTEQVLNGPGIQARGVAFAGTNLFVAARPRRRLRLVGDLGRQRQRRHRRGEAVQHRRRDGDGQSTGYLVGTDVRADATQTCTPRPRCPTRPRRRPPQTYSFLVLRTRHGIVQAARPRCDGKPVAIVLQRATYGHEVDSVVGFARLNNPRLRARRDELPEGRVSAIDYTFNWFYADDQDIAYYSSGLLPIAGRRRSTSTCRTGATRTYDWQGWLPFGEHAQQINPPRGYLCRWNNKPAPGFAAADDQWGYGAVYRVAGARRSGCRRAPAAGRRSTCRGWSA